MKFLLTLLIVLVLLLKLQFKFTPEFVVVDSRRAVTATVNYQYRRRGDNRNVLCTLFIR